MHNNTTAKEAMVLDNLGLVELVVKNYEQKFCEQTDLRAYGVLGLVEAAAHYESGMERSFSTFAVKSIQGRIIDGITLSLGAGRRMSHLLKKVRQAEEYLQQRHQRNISIREVCGYLGISEELYLAVQRYDAGLYPVPLEAETEYTLRIQDGSTVYQEEAAKTDLKWLRELVMKLPPLERTIIVGYYYKEMTCRELARYCHISPASVSRKHQKALQRLKQEILAN